MSDSADNNASPVPDHLLTTIADYVLTYPANTPSALETAKFCLMDAFGCAMLAMQYPACTRLLGPIIPGTTVPTGAHVWGTHFVLDPILAAFNIGTLVRWLDYNDTWLAAEWGHPSDNLGAILAIADYQSRKQRNQGLQPLSIKTVLMAMIKAYEIQGILALENAFNRHGIDHVILVKIASTAVATQLLGGNRDQIIAALSQAWIDGGTLRTYRHAPNTGSRKSWAAGDATSRAVRLAWLTLQGEKGYLSALSAKKWGFNDCCLNGHEIKLSQPFNSYVMDNILFKIAYPAEFHAQTAVECAIQLHPQIAHRLSQIDKIILTTQESAIRIISKTGPLHNPADRDHCLQYMVAVALLRGHLTAADYENQAALDPRIDELRNKMCVIEDPAFSQDYLDPQKRSIANAIQIFFKEGQQTEKVSIHYPIGHVKRRAEGIPLLYKKFSDNLSKLYRQEKIDQFLQLFHHQQSLEEMAVDHFIDSTYQK